MPEAREMKCRDCGCTYPYSVQDMSAGPQNNALSSPIRCPSCHQSRLNEDKRLFDAACADRSLGFTYRCNECRRKFRLLRPWKRAIGLLYCPDCKPALYRSMPYDAALNQMTDKV